MDIKVYTVDEIAELLQVGRKTVYDYIENGDLKAAKIGKYWKITEAALNDFLEKGTTAKKSDDEKLNELLGKYIEEYGFVVFAKRLQAYKKEHTSK